jgi:hypothetical protein
VKPTRLVLLSAATPAKCAIWHRLDGAGAVFGDDDGVGEEGVISDWLEVAPEFGDVWGLHLGPFGRVVVQA